MLEVKPILFIHTVTSYTWPRFFLLQPCTALKVFPLKFHMEVGLLLLRQYSNSNQKFIFKTPEQCFFDIFFHVLSNATSSDTVIDKTPVKPAVKTQSASQHWLRTTMSRWSSAGAQGATALEPCPKPDSGTEGPLPTCGKGLLFLPYDLPKGGWLPQVP